MAKAKEITKGITTELFGKTRDGKEISLYTITNANGMSASVMNYGAILVKLFVPDKKGKTADVVLGYDKLYRYFKNGGFFGCTVGPVANRTAFAKYKIGKKTVNMPVNDRGINNLHSDIETGFHKRVWDAKLGKNSVTFMLDKKDKDLGPGNMHVSVTYTLTDKNELKITYDATSDKPTAINMTNHSYFNLGGQKSADCFDTYVTIFSDRITAVNKELIPTGEFIDVKGTPFDFNEPKKIGKDIKAKDPFIKIAGGYDHNYEIRGKSGKLRKAAVAEDKKSGRIMEVFTDLPGMQFYTGNWLAKNIGKEGAAYGKFKGFAMETQFFPDAMNHDNFEKPLFGPEKDYHTVTVYKFSW